MKIKLRKISQRQDTVIKEVALVLFISLIGLLMHVGVRAQSDTVTATVTAQQVALSITPGSVDYGTLGIGTSATTAINDGDSVDATQSISNDGNVAADYDLQGTDTTAWTLGGTPGSNTYTHEFCDMGTVDCDNSPSWTALTTGTTSLTTSVGDGTTYPFDLRIQLPSSTTEQSTQNADVTVQASSAI